jgi:hypothetical protein
MRPKAVRTALALALLGAIVGGLSAGCGSAPPTSLPGGVDELVIPTPTPDPVDFVDRVDNPFLPLAVGSTWVYAARGQGAASTITVTVLPQRRTVAGVPTTVVHTLTRTARGDILEDTRALYAQDRGGNVWLFGEQTTFVNDGPTDRPTDGPTDGATDGAGRTLVSWRAGLAGAQAGLAMAATPRLGDGYLQGLAPGAVEDRATVQTLQATISVPYGDFDDVLQISETSAIEPGKDELTSYARGVGMLVDEDVTGGTRVIELTSFRRR